MTGQMKVEKPKLSCGYRSSHSLTSSLPWIVQSDVVQTAHFLLSNAPSQGDLIDFDHHGDHHQNGNDRHPYHGMVEFGLHGDDLSVPCLPDDDLLDGGHADISPHHGVQTWRDLHDGGRPPELALLGHGLGVTDYHGDGLVVSGSHLDGLCVSGHHGDSLVVIGSSLGRLGVSGHYGDGLVVIGSRLGGLGVNGHCGDGLVVIALHLDCLVVSGLLAGDQTESDPLADDLVGLCGDVLTANRRLGGDLIADDLPGVGPIVSDLHDENLIAIGRSGGDLIAIGLLIHDQTWGGLLHDDQIGVDLLDDEQRRHPGHGQTLSSPVQTSSIRPSSVDHDQTWTHCLYLSNSQHKRPHFSEKHTENDLQTSARS